MPGRASQLHQNTAILKVGEVGRHAETFRAHVREIVGSPALRGSKRSQEFLQFIVDRALDGRFDELKERTLGVELFGRHPNYDTGEDAIVRVTACDVRRRLLQYYASSGEAVPIRIELAPGSYIPEFRSVTHQAAGAIAIPAEAAPAASEVAVPAVVAVAEPIPLKSRLAYGLFGALVCSTIWYGVTRPGNVVTPGRVLPWSAVIQPNAKTHVVFCDQEIVSIQRMLGYSVTLSDYANQRYWPKPVKPELQNILSSFRGVTVAAVDAAIAAKIASFAAPGSAELIETHPARSIRPVDFKSDDNFVLFGSPRSNPWIALYQEQLDFRFEFDEATKSEFIRNRSPRDGETAQYVPTARGWGTGNAYAIVALVENPNQKGHVLILAGSNAEATEAAGRFATRVDLLSQALKSHGIEPQGAPRAFEVLLRVSTMAGSPNQFEVIACHLLPAK